MIAARTLGVIAAVAAMAPAGWAAKITTASALRAE